ncbi:hypothetical protein HY641_01465, partial [Candidatus Woesearchaeota archaeon]|nr:hypothetical protein [Candidatus Woesearchaeota archaeon]
AATASIDWLATYVPQAVQHTEKSQSDFLAQLSVRSDRIQTVEELRESARAIKEELDQLSSVHQGWVDLRALLRDVSKAIFSRYAEPIEKGLKQADVYLWLKELDKADAGIRAAQVGLDRLRRDSINRQYSDEVDRFSERIESLQDRISQEYVKQGKGSPLETQPRSPTLWFGASTIVTLVDVVLFIVGAWLPEPFARTFLMAAMGLSALVPILAGLGVLEFADNSWKKSTRNPSLEEAQKMLSEAKDKLQTTLETSDSVLWKAWSSCTNCRIIVDGSIALDRQSERQGDTIRIHPAFAHDARVLAHEIWHWYNDPAHAPPRWTNAWVWHHTIGSLLREQRARVFERKIPPSKFNPEQSSLLPSLIEPTNPIGRLSLNHYLIGLTIMFVGSVLLWPIVQFSLAVWPWWVEQAVLLIALVISFSFGVSCMIGFLLLGAFLIGYSSERDRDPAMTAWVNLWAKEHEVSVLWEQPQTSQNMFRLASKDLETHTLHLAPWLAAQDNDPVIGFFRRLLLSTVLKHGWDRSSWLFHGVHMVQAVLEELFGPRRIVVDSWDSGNWQWLLPRVRSLLRRDTDRQSRSPLGRVGSWMDQWLPWRRFDLLLGLNHTLPYPPEQIELLYQAVKSEFSGLRRIYYRLGQGQIGVAPGLDYPQHDGKSPETQPRSPAPFFWLSVHLVLLESLLEFAWIVLETQLGVSISPWLQWGLRFVLVFSANLSFLTW